jgi:hypothetical protein
MPDDDPSLAEVLQEQARALQALIKEAQRIHGELIGELEKLRRDGKPSARDRKR